MRIPIALLLLLTLGGCAVGVVPPQAWSFDPTQPQPKASLPPQEMAAITDRLAQLQLERNEIRGRIAGERDARARQQHYRELHRIGMELSPLERRLAMFASAR